MFRLEWLFLMQLAMGVLMIIFLQKLTQMKKQVDEITKEVINYISYITADMEEEIIQEPISVKKEPKKEEKTTKKLSRNEKEEAENRLIEAVLSEYFQ